MAIVINEIMPNPSAVFDSSGEWFELHNTGTDPVDINGWVISDNGTDSHTINNGGPLVIPPGGFLVLGNNDDTGTNGGVSVDYEYSGITLANVEDELILTDDMSMEIDRVEWTSGAFPFGAGTSAELGTAVTNGNNNNPSNWGAATTTYGSGDLGTPGQANVVFCFLSGTLIRCPRGDVPVEGLKIGDMIQTADGRTIAVKWLGRQSIETGLDLARAHLPVCVRAGALGPNRPAQDLFLTADHALLVDGLLINAGALVNGSSITWVPMTKLGRGYDVYHVETEDHDVIIANGTAAETFIDAASRANFDNYQEYLELYGVERIISPMQFSRVSSARLVPEAIKARLDIGVWKATTKRRRYDVA